MKDIKEYINESLFKYITPLNINIDEVKSLFKNNPNIFKILYTDNPIKWIFVCDDASVKKDLIQTLDKYSKAPDGQEYIDFSKYDSDKKLKTTIKWLNQYGYNQNTIYICDKSEGISEDSFDKVINNIFRSLSYSTSKTINYYIVK